MVHPINQYMSIKTYQKNSIVISFGKDFNPYPPVSAGSIMVSHKDMTVDFEGIALVVRDIYKPEYTNIKGFGVNHTFKIPVTHDYSYEYMIMGGWSDGAVLNTPEKFKEYVKKTAIEYNNPIEVYIREIERKQE